MSICPHCREEIPASAVRCAHCRHWIHQQTPTEFVRHFYIAVFSRPMCFWYGAIVIFFYGITLVLSLDHVHVRQPLPTLFLFALGQSFKSFALFVGFLILVYLLVRMSRLEINSRPFYRLRILAAILFLLVFYTNNALLPHTFHQINTQTEQAKQEALSAAINQIEWFGKVKTTTDLEATGLLPLIVVKPVNTHLPEVEAVFQGYKGHFKVDPARSHSVLFPHFLTRYQLHLPPDGLPLLTGRQSWTPIFLTFGFHNHELSNVLVWIANQPASEPLTIDGVLGNDLLTAYERIAGMPMITSKQTKTPENTAP